jgi:hypothetical protein
MWPQTHCSMHISSTLSYWTYYLLVGQHSALDNMAGSQPYKILILAFVEPY